MKSVLIIGLGSFGLHMAKKFIELGNDVMGVEIDEKRANAAAVHIPDVQIADATDEDVISSLGINNYDICVCAVEDFTAAIIIVTLLKAKGAGTVIARSEQDITRKLLLRNGADYVEYAERDEAEKLAIRFGAKNLFEYSEISRELGIVEVRTPKAWVDRTAIELDIRRKYNISVLAVRRMDQSVEQFLDPEYRFSPDEHLIVLGSPEALKSLIV